MTKSPKQEKPPRPRPAEPEKEDKPPRDTRDHPAPNPDGGLPDTSTREEVEAIRPNLKR